MDNRTDCMVLSLARSVDARSVNSPQVNKFLQVYHCSGDIRQHQGNYLLRYFSLFMQAVSIFTRLGSILSLIIVNLRFNTSV